MAMGKFVLSCGLHYMNIYTNVVYLSNFKLSFNDDVELIAPKEEENIDI